MAQRKPLVGEKGNVPKDLGELTALTTNCHITQVTKNAETANLSLTAYGIPDWCAF
jgi:hypothetical protein